MLIQSSNHDSTGDAPHVERLVITELEIPIARVLDMLGDRGIQSLLVEGGAETWARFLSEGLVDRARLCVSPIDLGGDGPVFTSSELEKGGLSLDSFEESSGDRIEWWTKAT